LLIGHSPYHTDLWKGKASVKGPPCWSTVLIIILTNLVVKTQKRHHFPKEQQSDPTPRFQSVAASAWCFSSLHLLSHKGRKGSHDCLFASHELWHFCTFLCFYRYHSLVILPINFPHFFFESQCSCKLCNWMTTIISFFRKQIDITSFTRVHEWLAYFLSFFLFFFFLHKEKNKI
jgi:hypothetical protein